MDAAPTTPDPTRPPDELRRPLAEGAIAARRPAAVAWATWCFGVAWLLALAGWAPWFAALVRAVRLGYPAAFLWALGALVGLMLLIQFGLLRGQLAAWAVAVNLSLVPVGLLAYWLFTQALVGATPLEALSRITVEAVAGAAALGTLILLLLPASRRWFWRASALRSQARRISIPQPGRLT